MDFEQYRSYVKTRWALGDTSTQIFKDLKTVYGTEAPSYPFVTKWVRSFENGRETIKDDPRSGRPITSLTERNIQLVKSIVEENPFVTYAEIEALTELHPPSINTILHEHLRLRKVMSRFVPHDLTEANKLLRVQLCKETLAKLEEGKWRLCDIITGDESWFYHRQIGHKQSNASWIGEGDSPRTVVQRNRFEPKTMFTIFFRTTRVMHISFVQNGKTITADSYVKDCLSPLFGAMAAQRPNAGLTNIKLLHDNAKPHTAQTTLEYLERKKVTPIAHPPYSPDLAPSDFWLFDHIKRHLDDEPDAQSLKKSITSILKNTPSSEFLKTFYKWKQRLQLCIDNNGEYFEHLSQ